MRIDRAGVPFILGSLVPAAAALALRRPGWAVAFGILAAYMAYFFRDPDRKTPDNPHAVIAPADGRVMVAGPGEDGVAPPGTWQQVTIFLSPLDVHVNRFPFSGRLIRVDYKRGRFLPAYRADSGAHNERTELWLEHGTHTIIFRQVVGVLARRIVCRARQGSFVRAGDRFGLMKFGSRMDVFLSPDARLRVEPGDTVVGGETIIALFPDEMRPD